MAETNDQEKTEEPTPKRYEEFRERGQVAKSQELSLVATFLTALGLFQFSGAGMFSQLQEFLASSFRQCATIEISASNLGSLYALTIYPYFKFFIPFFSIMLLAGIGVNLVQTGLLFSPKAMKFDLSRLDPIQGFKRMFSLTSLFELVKNLFKVAVIFAIVFYSVRGELDQIISLCQLDLLGIMDFSNRVLFTICYRIAAYLVILSLVDYLYKRWDMNKMMKMTKQEVKDERKNMHGDPKVKGEFIKKRHQIATSRIMQAVPRADVVVTNPTHFAVALEYDRTKMQAPRVVAKGKDNIALSIRELAQSLSIPVVENPPLARVLYASVKIGQQIPERLYAAVAEILAYVYKQGRRRK
ncbi:MAG: flagellar biosynthesis protein FlhB [Deltaproteobacteria bacterium RIFOXYA12_FULL_61_11]|nr:MAG: flagellar biosynthesis protein FlhB [Deltaproteobacteria bacterium RIFOXYA12_FULL_61_11]